MTLTRWQKILWVIVLDVIAIIALMASGAWAEGGNAPAPTATPIPVKTKTPMPTNSIGNRGIHSTLADSLTVIRDSNDPPGPCIYYGSTITFSWSVNASESPNQDPGAEVKILLPSEDPFITSSRFFIKTYPQSLFGSPPIIYNDQVSFKVPTTIPYGVYRIWVIYHQSSKLGGFADYTIGDSTCFGNLGVFKYEDKNGDGGITPNDFGEIPIDGLPIVITRASPPPDLTDTKQTGQAPDPSGWATWTHIPIGTFTVTEAITQCTTTGRPSSRPTRGTASVPGPLPILPITSTLVSFMSTQIVTFGNQYLGNLTVCKVDDQGTRLPGWDITLTPPLNFKWNNLPIGGGIYPRPNTIQTTGQNGCTSWSDLPVGVYTITEQTKPSWVPDPRNPSNVTVSTCLTTTTIITNTYIPPPPCITGRKIEKDTNPTIGLDNWTIHAQLASGVGCPNTSGSIATTKTFGGGYFKFTTLTSAQPLVPGWYKVWEELQPGWEPFPNDTRGSERCVEVKATNYDPNCAPVDPIINWMPPYHLKDIGINPYTHRLYVSNSEYDTIHVIDPALSLPPSPLQPSKLITEVARIQQTGRKSWGNKPYGVAVLASPSTTKSRTRSPRDIFYAFLPFIGVVQPPPPPPPPAPVKVYVANWGDDSIGVIDGNTFKVIKVIPLLPSGGHPTYIRLDPQTNLLYVALNSTANVGVIDTKTDTLVRTIAVGTGAFGIAVDSPRNRVYVSARDSLWIKAIDTLANTVAFTIEVSPESRYPHNEPYNLALDPTINNGQLYAFVDPDPINPGYENPEQVWVYPGGDPAQLSQIWVRYGGPSGGNGIAANPQTHNVYAANTGDRISVDPDPVWHSLSMFNGNALLTPPIRIDQSYDKRPFHYPGTIAIDPALGYVYVGNTETLMKDGLERALLVLSDR